MKNKVLITIICVLGLGIVIMISCKEQYIQGPKTSGTGDGKVYFPGDPQTGSLIAAFNNHVAIYNSVSNTIDVPIPVYLGGFSNFETVIINVSGDTDPIQSLVSSGKLPAGTVGLQSGDYTLNPTDSITYSNFIMQGRVTPQIKISSLEQYIGKVIALSLKITNSSQNAINDSMNQVVIYLPVDSLLGSVYFPANLKSNNTLIPALNTPYNYDKDANTVTFPIAINKNGMIPAANSLMANITVDNSSIDELVNSGTFPANTVVLPASDYTLNTPVTMSSQNAQTGAMTGNVMLVVNIQDLMQYSGTEQTFALGLTITSASPYGVNPAMNKIVLYFNVDDLLLGILNMLHFENWHIVNISKTTNINVTLNSSNRSVLFSGTNGNWQQQGIYQAVTVTAGTKYKIDMNVAGSGMDQSWFQPWVTDKQPEDGNDISATWTNGGANSIVKNLGGLNTWNGCGVGEFNGLLSQLQCEMDSAGLVTFPQSGTYYVVIKCGGLNLGTTGVTATNISMIPQ